MPLTKKGKKVMSSMKKTYGPKKGKQVFYASKNSGKIKGVEGGTKKNPVLSEAGKKGNMRKRLSKIMKSKSY